eukprot:6838393-Prymnesium_polylepis.1
MLANAACCRRRTLRANRRKWPAVESRLSSTVSARLVASSSRHLSSDAALAFSTPIRRHPHCTHRQPLRSP